MIEKVSWETFLWSLSGCNVCSVSVEQPESRRPGPTPFCIKFAGSGWAWRSVQAFDAASDFANDFTKLCQNYIQAEANIYPAGMGTLLRGTWVSAGRVSRPSWRVSLQSVECIDHLSQMSKLCWRFVSGLYFLLHRFGYLTMAMGRAVRVVVDTGIHAFRFAPEKKIQKGQQKSEICAQEKGHDSSVLIVLQVATWPGTSFHGSEFSLELRENRHRDRQIHQATWSGVWPLLVLIGFCLSLFGKDKDNKLCIVLAGMRLHNWALEDWWNETECKTEIRYAPKHNCHTSLPLIRLFLQNSHQPQIGFVAKSGNKVSETCVCLLSQALSGVWLNKSLTSLPFFHRFCLRHKKVPRRVSDLWTGSTLCPAETHWSLCGRNPGQDLTFEEQSGDRNFKTGWKKIFGLNRRIVLSGSEEHTKFTRSVAEHSRASEHCWK